MEQTKDNYDPNALLNVLAEKLKAKNDAALAKALDMNAPTISKLRKYRSPITASILIRMHEVTDMSIKELRTLMGQNCEQAKFFIAPDLKKQMRPTTIQ